MGVRGGGCLKPRDWAALLGSLQWTDTGLSVTWPGLGGVGMVGEMGVGRGGGRIRKGAQESDMALTRGAAPSVTAASLGLDGGSRAKSHAIVVLGSLQIERGQGH